MAVTAEMRESLAAKFEVILPHLDERQRRLLLAAEARTMGHGGIRAVAQAAGVRPETVAAGIDELESGALPLGRARRPGGGRKRASERDPGLRPALLALVEPHERGDPMSPLRWTTKSLRHLSTELARRGHHAGPDTVAGLLRQEGFSLQGNSRTLEGNRHPDRDAQFSYINEQVKDHQDRGDPVISVDTKKKELVGPFANRGHEWRPATEPVEVRTHDFEDRLLGHAIPYGVYDLTTDTGWVSVGTDHNTAAFAVATLRRWWDGHGRDRYPDAGRLLITADAGGSNGYRTRAWKTGLAALAAEIGLPITVCHFPPGTSKWNRIEHRLFAHISMNWRGRPLTSHETIINTITATTTRTGLRVHAELDTGRYPTGATVTADQLAALPIQPHHWHGDWNYTLHHTPGTPLAGTAPATTPTHDLTWLHHTAMTGHTTDAWHNLTNLITDLHPTTSRPRHGKARPQHTIADQVLAATLHHRFRISQKALAPLFGVRRETLNTYIQGIRQLLHRTGHTITRTQHRITTLDDLYTYAETHGLNTPDKIKAAS